MIGLRYLSEPNRDPSELWRRLLNRNYSTVMKFDENQPRDEYGRWVDTGGFAGRAAAAKAEIDEAMRPITQEEFAKITYARRDVIAAALRKWVPGLQERYEAKYAEGSKRATRQFIAVDAVGEHIEAKGAPWDGPDGKPWDPKYWRPILLKFIDIRSASEKTLPNYPSDKDSFDIIAESIAIEEFNLTGKVMNPERELSHEAIRAIKLGVLLKHFPEANAELMSKWHNAWSNNSASDGAVDMRLATIFAMGGDLKERERLAERETIALYRTRGGHAPEHYRDTKEGVNRSFTRAHMHPEAVETVKAMAALTQTFYPEEMVTLYRGIDSNQTKKILGATVRRKGDSVVVRIGALSSWTEDKNVAAQQFGGASGSVITARIPRSALVASWRSLGAHGGEKEVVVASRGSIHVPAQDIEFGAPLASAMAYDEDGNMQWSLAYPGIISDLGKVIAPAKKKRAVLKGDLPGHPFRGNQWTDGAATVEDGRLVLSFDAEFAPVRETAYHGTPGATFSDFNNTTLSNMRSFVSEYAPKDTPLNFATSHQLVAESYTRGSGNVAEVEIDFKHPLVINAQGKTWDEVMPLAVEAATAGYRNAAHQKMATLQVGHAKEHGEDYWEYLSIEQQKELEHLSNQMMQDPVQPVAGPYDGIVVHGVFDAATPEAAGQGSTVYVGVKAGAAKVKRWHSVAKYDESQPRDEHGRWTGNGSSFTIRSNKPDKRLEALQLPGELPFGTEQDEKFYDANIEAMEDWFRNKLPEEQQQALKMYQRYLPKEGQKEVPFRGINAEARNPGSSPESRPALALIDAALNTAPVIRSGTDKDTVLLRAMSDKRIAALSVGDEFVDNGIVSATYSLLSAKIFASTQKVRGDIVRMVVPKGIRGYMDYYISMESEVIFPRGYKYRVTREVRSPNGERTIELTVLGK